MTLRKRIMKRWPSCFLKSTTRRRPTGRGRTRGAQYRSAVFYADSEQKECAEKLIRLLREKGLDVVTQVLPLAEFWPAEDYHQHYYERKGTQPYCHRRVKTL